MHKSIIKEKAIKLRNDGYGYKYISEETGVAYSTLSNWLADIEYVANSETLESMGKARSTAAEKKSKTKKEELGVIKEEALSEVSQITSRDLFMFGLGLYLGEGSKTHDIVRISNSDPNVILLAIAWFKELGLATENLFLTIHLYPDSPIDECLQFWSTTTTIPISQFGKVQIDTRSGKKKQSTGKLPYGTAHLSIRSAGKKEFGVILSRKINAWTQVMIEKITRD